jgi:hypothetical protein
MSPAVLILLVLAVGAVLVTACLSILAASLDRATRLRRLQHEAETLRRREQTHPRRAA